MIRHFRILAVVLLTTALLWVPLPFASITRVGQMIVGTVAFVLLALVLAGVPRWRDLRPAALPAAALAVIGLWGVVQSLPLPAGLLRWLSPGHQQLYEAAGMEGGPLSLAPAASLRAALF